MDAQCLFISQNGPGWLSRTAEAGAQVVQCFGGGFGVMRVVAKKQKSGVFDGFGEGASGGLFFVGREKEGPVLLDAQMVAKGLRVVGVEQVGAQIAEAEPGDQAEQAGVDRPDVALRCQ